jgi:Lar family restriction alleviation protein
MKKPNTKKVLKPCPFCGNKPTYKTFHDGFARWHRIECLLCKIFMDKLKKDEVYATWNKRANNGGITNEKA